MAALGQSMSLCINHVADVLRNGKDQGVLRIEDADYTANVLWTQTLGTMHLARLRVGLRQAAPGFPRSSLHPSESSKPASTTPWP